jgi:hypothetical protein
MNAKQKQKAEARFQLIRKRLVVALEILESDVKFSETEWLKDKSSQFWGRTIIRCCCAWVEGAISLLKQFALEIADYSGAKLTEKDTETLTEYHTDKNGIKKPAFLPFRENIKETFKVFKKARKMQPATKYDDSRFIDLCDTFELRNKLMHPKKHQDLEVSKKALDTADRAVNWFAENFREIIK